MLLQFSVENFLSIKEKAVLSLLASSDDEHIEHTVLIDKNNRGLKLGVIYGANASGKSNVLRAFQFMVSYVISSHAKQVNVPTERIPFKFDPNTPNMPSSFEVIFIVAGIRYVYGFSVSDQAVTEEYLYHYPQGRKAIVFERKNVDEYRFTSDADLQNTLKERNSANKLYLSTAANWNYAKVKPVFEWFSSCTVNYGWMLSNSYGENMTALRNEAYRRDIVEMLKIADLGIAALAVKDAELGFFDSLLGSYKNIETTHQIRAADGAVNSYTLRMDEESDGTRDYFSMISIIKRTLDSGSLFVADELDAHLHPLLMRHIVSLFNSEKSNPNGAQLVFATHNTNILDLAFLRRDQIWFTEKDDQTGATELFSLCDFSVRKDSKVEKNYLIGRYGAIPFIQGEVQ